MGTMVQSSESFTFTVGKLDAGMAILLGERAHLIEFPSILLPPGASAGSIVNIAVHRNVAEEKRRDQEFWDLQRDIYNTFGVDAPQPPKLEVRNVTQTSVTLEWPALYLATAKLRSLDIHRNGQRLAAIPQPLHNTSTKLSGLELNTDYSFQLFLRTTAGTFPSEVVRVRTHTMTDTSGISVCFGTVQDKVLLEHVKVSLREMRARWSDKIQIDTTHFVCTTPAAEGAGPNAGPGVEYQRALQLSIPVVQPQWILACHNERKMIPIAQYYLGATPNTPLNSAPFTRPQSMSQVTLQRSPSRGPTSPTGATSAQGAAAAANRASMPPQRRSTAQEHGVGSKSPPAAATVSSPQLNGAPAATPSVSGESSSAKLPGTKEEEEGDDNVKDKEPGVEAKAEGEAAGEEGEEDDGEGEDEDDVVDPSPKPRTPRTPLSAAAHARNGTMDKNFRFPPPSPPASASASISMQKSIPSALSPTATEPMEVPPPDPVEKERATNVELNEADEDIGYTEEIELN